MNKRLFYQNGFTRTGLSATVTRVSDFVEENMCVCGVFLHRQGSPSRWIQSTQQVKYADRNALSMFKEVKMRSFTIKPSWRPT